MISIPLCTLSVDFLVQGPLDRFGNGEAFLPEPVPTGGWLKASQEK
jgi:hypothetical protein